jgi:hypothetical protein
MLTLLILGGEIVNNDNIDVYLQPLVEDLEALWEGILTYDVNMPNGFQRFLLKAICLRMLTQFFNMYIITGCYQLVTNEAI